MVNQNAQALAALAKGVKRHLSPEERERRRERVKFAREALRIKRLMQVKILNKETK